MMGGPQRDLTGLRFGKMVVIKRGGKTRHGQTMWSCRRDDGRETQVSTSDVKKYEQRANGIPSPTYWSWHAMKQRCLNPNNARFSNYGGRGIKVCKRWLNSFPNFLADMGERPAGMTLDRYPNNDGDYKPSNCRWATASEQASNRRKPTPETCAKISTGIRAAIARRQQQERTASHATSLN